MVFGLLWGPLLRLPERPQEPNKLSMSDCGMGLEPRFSIGAFFEDSLTKSLLLLPRGCPNRIQIIAKSLAIGRKSVSNNSDFAHRFLIESNVSASGLGRSTPELRPGPSPSPLEHGF